MKQILCLSILFFVGCQPQLNQNNVDAERAAAVTAASLSDGASVDVTPNKKVKRSECTVCKGTGHVRHGDGHTTECPNCEPDPKDVNDEVKQEEASVSQTEPKCCGPDCTCEKCECKAKECLAKCCGPECKCEKCECKDKECLKAALKWEYSPSDDIVPDNEDESYTAYLENQKLEEAERLTKASKDSQKSDGCPLAQDECPVNIHTASYKTMVADKKCEDCKCENCTCKDGEKCVCENCECNRSKDMSNVRVGQRCCDDCICAGACLCTYPGECLVKANNGQPVKVCHDGVCTTYSPPAQQEPKNVGGVEENMGKRITVAQDMLKHAARSYLSKDYEKAGRYIEYVVGILNTKQFGDAPEMQTEEVKTMQRKVAKAMTMLKEQGVDFEPVYVFPKKEYDDFLFKYSEFLKEHENMKAQLNQMKNQGRPVNNGVRQRNFRGSCATCG